MDYIVLVWTFTAFAVLVKSLLENYYGARTLNVNKYKFLKYFRNLDIREILQWAFYLLTVSNVLHLIYKYSDIWYRDFFEKISNFSMFCFLIILTIILILKVLTKNTNTKSVLSALVALTVGQVLVNLSISVDIYSAKNLLNLIELLKQQYSVEVFQKFLSFKLDSIYFSFSVVAVLSSILFLLNWINNCKDLIYEDYKFFFKVILLSIVFAILIDSFKHEIHKKETKVSIVKEIG